MRMQARREAKGRAGDGLPSAETKSQTVCRRAAASESLGRPSQIRSAGSRPWLSRKCRSAALQAAALNRLPAGLREPGPRMCAHRRRQGRGTLPLSFESTRGAHIPLPFPCPRTHLCRTTSASVAAGIDDDARGDSLLSAFYSTSSPSRTVSPSGLNLTSV